MFNSSIQLGPLILHWNWIVIAAGFLLSYILLTYYSPFRGKSWKEVREAVVTGIGLFIITFFFGTILLRFTLFLSDPMAVISYPSGRYELYLALLVVVVYLIFISWKDQVDISRYLHGILYLLLPTTFIYAFFQQKQGMEIWHPLSSLLPWSHHPISLYLMVFAAILLLWVLRVDIKEEINAKVIVIFMLWVLVHYLTTWVDNAPLFFGIPITPLFYLLLLIVSSGISIRQLVNKKKESLTWKN